jgi:phosphatidylinositol glycan class O
MPLLQQPQQWDVLLAHYLGVDHAGHTHGVRSRQMVGKVAQMDEQVAQIIGGLLRLRAAAASADAAGECWEWGPEG